MAESGNFNCTEKCRHTNANMQGGGKSSAVVPEQERKKFAFNLACEVLQTFKVRNVFT